MKKYLQARKNNKQKILHVEIKKDEGYREGVDAIPPEFIVPIILEAHCIANDSKIYLCLNLSWIWRH